WLCREPPATATHPLSLHDALPISHGGRYSYRRAAAPRRAPSRVQSPAPLGAAPEPRREGGLVARLERPLQLAQRLFERAQSREQFVTVHEKNLGPEGGLGGCEARSVARPGPEGRTRRRRPSEIVREQRRHRLRQVARQRELAVVL